MTTLSGGVGGQRTRHIVKYSRDQYKRLTCVFIPVRTFSLTILQPANSKQATNRYLLASFELNKRKRRCFRNDVLYEQQVSSFVQSAKLGPQSIHYKIVQFDAKDYRFLFYFLTIFFQQIFNKINKNDKMEQYFQRLKHLSSSLLKHLNSVAIF